MTLSDFPFSEIMRKQAKMSGSASLAQIEGKSLGVGSWHRQGSSTSARKIRKGYSEPQLGQSETSNVISKSPEPTHSQAGFCFNDAFTFLLFVLYAFNFRVYISFQAKLAAEST